MTEDNETEHRHWTYETVDGYRSPFFWPTEEDAKKALGERIGFVLPRHELESCCDRSPDDA